MYDYRKFCIISLVTEVFIILWVQYSFLKSRALLGSIILYKIILLTTVSLFFCWHDAYNWVVTHII